MSSPEAPLLCCAWAAGCTKGRAVVGSAAGWLSVVDMEDLLPDNQPVSTDCSKRWSTATVRLDDHAYQLLFAMHAREQDPSKQQQQHGAVPVPVLACKSHRHLVNLCHGA
jgi:hypothetical protein